MGREKRAPFPITIPKNEPVDGRNAAWTAPAFDMGGYQRERKEKLEREGSPGDFYPYIVDGKLTTAEDAEPGEEVNYTKVIAPLPAIHYKPRMGHEAKCEQCGRGWRELVYTYGDDEQKALLGTRMQEVVDEIAESVMAEHMCRQRVEMVKEAKAKERKDRREAKRAAAEQKAEAAAEQPKRRSGRLSKNTAQEELNEADPMEVDEN